MGRAPFLLLVAVLLLAACGSSSTRLSKEEYASKADAICGKYNEQTKKLQNPRSLSDLAKVADRTLPLLDGAIKDLQKLRPPASEQALADQWVMQVGFLKRDVQEIRDKAKANDLKGVQAVVPRGTEHNSQSSTLARELGMSVCSKN